jgi:oxygen-dependent protoporphyrinogen oxidase
MASLAASDDPDRFDVVIVGGGISGLSAAWSLRDRSIRVLESAEVVGGRLKSEMRPPYWLNLGAHVLMAGGPMARLAEEVGVPLTEPPGSFLSVAVGGKVIRARSAAGMFLRLPMPLAARLSLARARLRMLAARSMPDSELEAMSFADLLGPLHPEAEALMRVVANRLTGELNEISAYVGIHGYAHLWLGSRLNIVGGSAELPAAIRRRLGERVTTGAHVERVRNTDDGVAITYRVLGALRSISARACILAVPAPIALATLDTAPDPIIQALSRVRYTPFVVAGIFTQERGPMPWDDIYALAVPNRSFCMMFNPANVLRGAAPRVPGGGLVVYAVAQRAAALLELDDDSIRRRYLADLADIFPGIRDVPHEVLVQRWPWGTATGMPGRAATVAALAGGFGGIAFAGDYMMPVDGTDASDSGALAAALVRRQLCLIA